ncbi:hypothetical protein CLTEP_24770 [Clostridium tepidiprofundi DSM 19306]|uniref:Uncharacterized protein n=1 Tax=Clostridium tepidiprofundi DSM 19306 TaxID=1121338 RepID=A0A151ATE8_9CLOT|nr:hypothetical protein [Clostridium tepidiprofundi]KYH30891.1 hypothetical protein CLTEP_24770 [Clostridium tepidiprofundi DSM 19306]
MFFKKKKAANIDPYERQLIDEENRMKEVVKSMTFKDFLAIMIAQFEIIMPFALIFVGIIVFVMLFMTKVWLR